MKERLSGSMKKFSQAIIQPVMFMAVTGILLAVGVILQMNGMPAQIFGIGAFIKELVMNASINQLSVIFCVGIATALAKRKKVDAAILSISIFLIFLYANNAWLTSHGLLVEAASLSGTGQAMVLGVQVVDMGVFLGIILGCLTGYIFNKFSETQFPDVIRVYGGSRLAYLIAFLVTVAFAIAMCYVWPVVNAGISASAGLIEQSGNFGLFIYGFLNRFLIPTGMHHLVYMPFLFTPVAGTAEIAGQTVSGTYGILMAELGAAGAITEMHASVKYMMFGFSKVFGTVGITLAFIKSAPKEKKKQVMGMLIPLVLVAVLTGITEPLEFSFLFVSPILWLVHSVLDGLFQVLIVMLGARLPFAGGIIDALPSLVALPASLTKWYITLGVGIAAIPIWYFVFAFLIKKLNLKTPGREDEAETVAVSEAEPGPEAPKAAEGTPVQDELGDINDIIDGLGGRENIVTVNNCFTRLRVEVKDYRLIKEDRINKFKNSGIVKKGSNVQIIIGMRVQTVREDICELLGLE